MNRRIALKTAGLASVLAFTSPISFATNKKKYGKFKFCLNTSTISGQQAGIKKYIDIAARAGYDYIEPWVMDIQLYLKQGGSLKSLKKLLDDSKVGVADAIGFAPWMVDDAGKRKAGFVQMKEEMEMMATLGCIRSAAPAAGVDESKPLNLFKVGEYYKQLLELGRQTGVTPLLEFWGSSPVFFHIGQTFMACAVANEKGVKILPDVYHLYRGDSGFDCLDMIDGNLIDIIHINDYPSSIKRESLEDKDRIYPGDGIAPYSKIIQALNKMSGEKILSLELFNEKYWKQDMLEVATTGLQKMQSVVSNYAK